MNETNNINQEYAIELSKKIKQGDRLALSRAITLIESKNPNHFIHANELLDACNSESGKSIRIGITGTPGVGKSTFIEALGMMYIQQGRKVAVLTIDPSSPMNRGSILGDKSRMAKLSHHPNAYVRSSPTRTTLGGTTDRTRETIILCETSQYDIIIVETVGVGQSETEIVNITDLLLLLTLPGAGDELQGIKRGIVEVADIIVVNKSDKFKKEVFQETINALKFSTHLKPIKSSQWVSKILSCSAITSEGLQKVLSVIESYFEKTIENGYFQKRRNEQSKIWLQKRIENEAFAEIRKRIGINPDLEKIKSKVISKEWSINKATSEILKSIFS